MAVMVGHEGKSFYFPVRIMDDGSKTRSWRKSQERIRRYKYEGSDGESGRTL